MKTLLLTGALALSTLFTQADPTRINSAAQYRANSNLQSMFGNVRNVNWQPAINNMLRASFNSYGENISVFFDASGEYLATTRELTVLSVPMPLRLAIEEKFEGQVPAQVFELISDQDQGWFFKANNAKGKAQVWKGYENGRIEAYMLAN
jgi:hypothetical protein